ALLDHFGAKHLDAVPPFACITHSTGGPVLREWSAALVEKGLETPLTHLIMLAPANHGSALAQLGSSRLGRIKSWFGGVEPGELILRWLELGSAEQWTLNTRELKEEDEPSKNRPFRFVLSGQTIDRKLYDHLNSYTDEAGSDGVVRLAAANLNYRLVDLVQTSHRWPDGSKAHRLEIGAQTLYRSRRTPFLVIPNVAHSGRDLGIMRSVSLRGDRPPIVDAILRCLDVQNADHYEALADSFAKETEVTQLQEKVERCSMISFCFQDDQGEALQDYDMLLLAGPDWDPDLLPNGFFKDRQRNSKERNKLIYYLSHDRMSKLSSVGIRVTARPQGKLAGYLPAEFRSSAAGLKIKDVLLANETTLVRVTLLRRVDREVFRIDSGARRRSFKGARASGDL
ncbi:MAG: hypothetical protein AAGA65_29585, partial [Actinomycetota bacterium]